MTRLKRIDFDVPEDGPSLKDLAEIENEWPLIAAELDVLDAEITILNAEPGGPSELDWRRLRRAEGRVLQEAVAYAARTAPAAPVRRAA